MGRRPSSPLDGAGGATGARSPFAPVSRLARLEDAGEIAAIYAPFVRDTTISFESRPPGAEEMRERIRVATERLPWLVTEAPETGRVVGYAYASQYRSRPAYQWGAEVSVYVEPGWQRRGVAATLYRALFEILRAQGYRTLYAAIALPSPGSIAFHAAHAFTEIGVFPAAGYKLGRWCDVLWMRRELQPPVLEPRPTRPLPALAPEELRAAIHPKLDPS